MDTYLYFCDKNMDNNQFAAHTCIIYQWKAERPEFHKNHMFGCFKSYLVNEFSGKNNVLPFPKHELSYNKTPIEYLCIHYNVEKSTQRLNLGLLTMAMPATDFTNAS